MAPPKFKRARTETTINAETLKELRRVASIARGKNPAIQSKGLDDQLLAAVRGGDVNRMVRLLKGGVDPARSPGILHEALSISSKPDAVRIVRMLLAAGARTSSRNKSGATPLIRAAKMDHGNFIDALLNAKAHVGTRNQRGMTALHHAARSGKIEIIKKLINAGANPHLRDRQGPGYTAFDHANRRETAQSHAISVLYASSHRPVMHRAPVVKTQKALRAEIVPWTGDIYTEVRRLRTVPKKHDNDNDNADSPPSPTHSPYNSTVQAMTAHHTNHALTRMMQSRGMLRAPETPPGVDVHVGGLYRGISGAAADTLERTGILVDPSYVATSLERSVSGDFSYKGILIFFPFRNIPRGTPWIWFGHRPKSAGRKRLDRGTILTDQDETEVLLPPGTIRLVPGHSKDGVKVAEFTPNPHFMKGYPK